MIEVTDDDFAAKVVTPRDPVLVLYVAGSQDESRELLRLVAAMEAEYLGRVRFLFVDIERSAVTARECSIIDTPLVAYYFGGREDRILLRPFTREHIASALPCTSDS